MTARVRGRSGAGGARLTGCAAVVAAAFAFAACIGPEGAARGAGEAAEEPAGTLSSGETPHLTFSTRLVAHDRHGDRLSIVADVVPAPGMYVYAPGSAYQAAEIQVDPAGMAGIVGRSYPAGKPHVFEPLQERTVVYDSPFRFTTELVVDRGGGNREPRPGTIRGSLEYQACDATVCYLPASIPLAWEFPAGR